METGLPAPNVWVQVTGDGGAPVSCGTVQILPASARLGQWEKAILAETDRHGTARISLMPGQRYRVVEVGLGQDVRVVGRELTVPSPPGPEPLLVPIPLAANVVAALRDETGSPLPLALLAIRPDDGTGRPVPDASGRTIFARTNRLGHFSLDLPPGAYHVVEADAAGFHRWTSLCFEVTEQDGFRGTLMLPPNSSH